MVVADSPDPAECTPGHACRPPGGPFGQAQKPCRMHTSETVPMTSTASYGPQVDLLTVCHTLGRPHSLRVPHARLHQLVLSLKPSFSWNGMGSKYERGKVSGETYHMPSCVSDPLPCSPFIGSSPQLLAPCRFFSVAQQILSLHVLFLGLVHVCASPHHPAHIQRT
jgi:hypothetical protein